MVALLLVAASIGLDTFAVTVGFGLSGVTNQIRLRVGLVFGTFQAGMPIGGLLLGHRLAHSLGHTTRWVGAGLLIATGVYGTVTGLLDLDTRPRSSPGRDRSAHHHRVWPSVSTTW
jgi:putative Mn2+ efflux pump MntP